MSTSSPLQRLGIFLGLRRSMVGLLGMVVLVGLGEKMAERFLPIYVLALGGGSLAVGLLNGLDNLLSALYSYPGGWLSERYGAKRALLIFNLIAMLGFLIVILVPSWPAVLVGSIFFLSWTAISLPATMSLVAEVLPRNKRTMGVSIHSLVRRIPMALGPIIGGLCISRWGERDGVRAAFGVALGMSLLAAFIQQILIDEDSRERKSTTDGATKLYFQLSPPLVKLLISDILIRFCEQIPYAFVVIWCMKEIEHPVTAPQFGVLTAVEMATAMLVYIPVAWLADRGGKKPFVLITFVNFTLFPLVLLFSHSFWALLGAFVVRGLKEFGEPTRKALIMDLAPEGHKAAAFGTYYLMRDLVVAVAAFGGGLLWHISPTVNLLAASAFGVLGTAWFALRGEDAPIANCDASPQ